MPDYDEIQHGNLDIEKLDFFSGGNTDTLQQIFNTARDNELDVLKPLRKNIDHLTPALRNMRDANIDVEIFIPDNSYFQRNNIVNFEDTKGAVLRIYDAEYFIANDPENENQVLLSGHTINKSFANNEQPCLDLLATMKDRQGTHHFDLTKDKEKQDLLNMIFFSAADCAAMQSMREDIAQAQNIDTLNSQQALSRSTANAKPSKLSLKTKTTLSR